MSGQTIGIIGLGNVGLPLALNLLKTGFDVVGFDIRPSAEFEAGGGRPASTIAELTLQTQTIVQSLPNPAALASSVDAMVQSAQPGTVLIEISSYPMAIKIGAAQRLAAAQVTMLDCEISGLSQQVAKREAVILKSGAKDIIDKVTPVFDAIATRHFYLGGFGAATKMKLIANMMVCAHNLVAAEALNLAVKVGLDAEQVVRVLGPSAAGSSTFTNKAPLMVQRQFENGRGPFRHMFGYLDRADELARGVDAFTPILHTTKDVYGIAQQQERHDQDIAAIIEIVEARGA